MKTKISQVIPQDTVTEQDWQVLMREREAMRKLKSKENADRAGRAEVSEMEEGDLVLLQNKFPNNKLATNYEEKPYQVIEKHGNAAVIENEDGIKMRNTNQMKKLIQTENDGMETQVDDGDVVIERDKHGPDIEHSGIQELHESRTQETNMETQKVQSPQVAERPLRNRKMPKKYEDYEVDLTGRVKKGV